MIVVKGNYPPEKIRRLVQHTSKSIAGLEPDKYGLAAKYWAAVTHSLFESIFAAFLEKSKHGVDELGGFWKDLSPEYKAYGRPDARENLALYDNRAVLHPNLRVRPTLPPSANRQWGGRWLGLYMRLFLGVDGKTAGQIAGGSTWDKFKAMGYPTLIGLTQNMKLPLLNRTGALQRSLFPAPLSGGLYFPLDKNQIVRSSPGKLVIGAKHPNLKAIDAERPLWPKNISKWLNRANGAGRDAVYNELPQVLNQIK